MMMAAACQSPKREDGHREREDLDLNILEKEDNRRKKIQMAMQLLETSKKQMQFHHLRTSPMFGLG